MKAPRRKIDIDALPSNNQTRSNKKEIAPVTKGNVKTGRKGGVAREIRNIGNSLFDEIVIPAVKSAIVDFFSNGVNMFMFRSEFGNSPMGSRRSYNKMYKGPGSQHKLISRNSPRVPVSAQGDVYEDVFFDRREDAQHVLGRMMELVAEYGVVRIGDLYSLVGLASNYTHQRWGWEDISHCRVHYSSQGYYIDFPEPEYFN